MVTSTELNVAADNDIRVAFLGNSILYFNDCPRLLERMLQYGGHCKVYQDSCLRGGASLPSLWRDGNGMQTKFGSSPLAKFGDGLVDIGSETVSALLQSTTNTKSSTTNSISIDFNPETKKSWDYVIMNDTTQGPARLQSREETIAALFQHYGPLLASTCPILLQTAAYRCENVNDSGDLGTVVDFTQRVREGYAEYAKVLQTFSPNVRVAPVGDAFLWVHNHNINLWKTLFHIDDFHPSPHGTWLQACVLYCTILKKAPPVFQLDFFASARYWQGLSDAQSLSPLPSLQEAEELRKAACIVCDVRLDTLP